MSYLCTGIKRSRSAEARVNPLVDPLANRFRGAGLGIAVSIASALIIGGSCKSRKVAVVSRQLAGPDRVRGSGLPESFVEAGYSTDLRRVKVEQHRRRATLRHVAERRLAPLPFCAKDARSRPHPRPDCTDYRRLLGERLPAPQICRAKWDFLAISLLCERLPALQIPPVQESLMRSK